jgi:hypothetical protein
MTLSRRKTLALDRRWSIVAAAAASPSRSPAARRRACALGGAGQYDDPRMRALSWAILAPNPHNLQPWKVDLSVPVRPSPLPRSRPPAAADRPVQSPDHRIAGLFPGASAHGGLQDGLRRRGRPVPRRRGSRRPRRTPRRDLPLRPRDRCARSALRRCRHAAQQQGTLRHVAARSRPRCWPGSPRSRVIPRSGSPWPGDRSRSFAP